MPTKMEESGTTGPNSHMANSFVFQQRKSSLGRNLPAGSVVRRGSHSLCRHMGSQLCLCAFFFNFYFSCFHNLPYFFTDFDVPPMNFSLSVHVSICSCLCDFFLKELAKKTNQETQSMVLSILFLTAKRV